MIRMKKKGILEDTIVPKNQKKDDSQDKVEELTAALQRERADAMNIRRRHEEQVKSLKNVVKADITRELLPVIDNFERAMLHVPKELEKNDYIKGVRSVAKQFEKTLNDIGVSKIKTVGEQFDPHFHEAVSGEGEIISEELQPGYKLGDQVIRHAMVKVSVK
jgi:molecular chaperone GrpE